ncbi:uncharacterized protein LOC117922331 isoform X2 [Vitis riparia]|uniref:uncharacterized protein LOC117922331 isoform X2 n=1 Tax=Vitis riparia TaxID=96939 RepID=UPI00155B308A|nr:uncharacterized protein LOC117922331 isoform X2 [Vitis riparia]
MTMLSSNHCNLWLGIQNHPSRGRFNQIICPGSGPYIPSRGSFFFHGQCLAGSSHQSARRCRPIFSSTVDDGMDPDDSEDGIDKKQPSNGELGGVNSEMIRENLERIIGSDDSTFSGLDLATLIRNKYGRSYDVLLIKKEFMGRNLLALNVMWKYMEQTVSWFSVAACKDLIITHSGFKFWMVSCGMPHDITCPDIGLVQSR